MSIEMKGMDRLVKKLEGLEHIHIQQAIESVKDEAIQEIRQGASFDPKSSACVGQCDVRSDKHYYYIDIGLKNDNAPFEQWKAAYFHNYGYHDRGLSFGDNGPYIDMHRQWFDQAVNTLSKSAKKKIKTMLEAELRRKLS